MVTAAERADENIGAAVKQAEASGIYTQPRQGATAEFTERAMSMLREIIPFDMDELLKYYVKMGYVKVDKAATQAAGDGAPVYTASKRLNTEQITLLARVTKSYLMSTTMATKQMAQNFLLKVKNGEDALVEGLAFARQMQHTSRFGGFILGWHQDLGRGVAFQSDRLMRSSPGRELGELPDATADEAARLPGYATIFEGIASKMNDPATMGEAINELIDLARRVEFLEEPMRIARVSTSLEIAGRAWPEVFINGLLSGPATFAANAAGMGWAVARPIMQLGAASAYAALGLPGAMGARQAAAEAMASIIAINSAWSDAWALGTRALRTESSIYQAKYQRAIGSAPIDQYLMERGMGTMDDGLRSTIDALGGAIRLPSRFLLGSDEFAKHLVVRGEVASRAVKRAMENGIDVTDKKKFQEYLDQEMKLAFNFKAADGGDIADIQEKWKLKTIYDLENGIMAEADRATFQEDNSWANNVSRALQIPVIGPMVRPFIPFVRTPLNILKQGFVESTGLGAVLNVGKTAIDNGGNPTATLLALQQQYLRDPGEAFRVAGQIAVTTAAAAVMYAGVMDGRIVGGGPRRWSSRNSDAQVAWERWIADQGRIPYSIRVGDTNIPFDRFGEPISIVLRMVADAGMYSSYVDYSSQEEWMAGIAGIMASGLYQASFLRGIDDLMSLLTDPDMATGGKRASRAVQNWVATQTPFGGLLNYVRQVEDPYRRAYGGATFIEAMRVHEDTYGSIFGRLIDRLPGVGKAPIMVDQVTARPVPIMPGGGPTGVNPLQMAIPFLPRGGDAEDGAWSVIFNVKGSYREKRPSGIKLTNAEQQELNKLMGESTIGGRTLEQAIIRFGRRADVQNFMRNKAALKSDEKAAIEDDLDEIVNDYYQAAWMEMLQRNSSVARRYLLSGAKRDRLSQNDLAGAEQVESEIDQLFRLARSGR
jgi:hypothetical protein